MFIILMHDIRKNFRSLILFGFLFALSFQVFMLLSLMIRFQAFPNYVTLYNWFENVSWIIESTPSWWDVIAISWEEWVLEVGYMNYDYGMGLSEWSLNVIPSRVVVLLVLGVMIRLCFVLMKNDTCDARNVLRATTGFGATLVAMTNATMSWVVCCATPTWVVGLAMMGLGVSTSLALETMGPYLSGVGFGVLVALLLFLSWRKSKYVAGFKGVVANA